MGPFTRDITGSRQMVEMMRSKIVDTSSVAYHSGSHSPSLSANAVSTSGEFSEPDGVEIQYRVRNQLDSMNSEKLRTALGVIDAASKVCTHPATG